MYRITENGAKSGGTVDFLSSHNSADANGSAAFLTFAFAGGDDTLNSLNLSTVTEYCVEMEDVPCAPALRTLTECPFRPRLRCSGAAGGRTT